MKVLLLTENYFPKKGGMAQSCDRIVHSLRETLPLDVCYLNHSASHLERKKRTAGEDLSVPIGESLSHTLNCLWNILQRKHENEKYSHVIAFGGRIPLLAAPMFSAWLRIPLLTLIRGNDFDSNIFSFQNRHVLLDALDRSDIISAVTKEKQERIQTLFPRKRVLYIPNGIDCNHWNANPADYTKAKAWKDKYVPAGKILIGMFGELKEKKGLRFLLSAAKQLAEQSRLHFLLIGSTDDPTNELLSSQTHQFSYTSLPFLDRYDLLSYYLACDFIAIPSLYDGLPNVLLEACALKIPVIAADVGGMKDVLPKKYPLLFFPGDEESCQKSLALACSLNYEERVKLGESLMLHVRDCFSHSREHDAYIQALQSLLPSATQEKRQKGETIQKEFLQ